MFKLIIIIFSIYTSSLTAKVDRKCFRDIKRSFNTEKALYECESVKKACYKAQRKFLPYITAAKKCQLKTSESAVADQTLERININDSNSDKSIFESLVYGGVQHRKFQIPKSPLDFKYDILYYIPKNLKGSTAIKALVFLHGGGASTANRTSSLSVAKSYMDDLISIAEDLNIMLILPSGSSHQWSYHTSTYLRAINKELSDTGLIDMESIGLSGHSMGGMAITREAQNLADQYAFMMPIAAGMADYMRKDHNLLSYFNFPYTHLQGKYDHFQSFISRTENQIDAVTKLEKLHSMKAPYKVIFYEGSHNYDKVLLKNQLKDHFKLKINRNQKVLFGNFLSADRVDNNQYTYNYDLFIGARRKYFWIELGETTKELASIYFKANIENNNIRLSFSDSIAKSIYINIDNEMLNFNKEIKIFLNDHEIDRVFLTGPNKLKVEF